MTKQPLSVTEMFSSIMELLEQAGYAKHTLWGNMYGSIRSVVNFYHEKGIRFSQIPPERESGKSACRGKHPPSPLCAQKS